MIRHRFRRSEKRAGLPIELQVGDTDGIFGVDQNICKVLEDVSQILESCNVHIVMLEGVHANGQSESAENSRDGRAQIRGDKIPLVLRLVRGKGQGYLWPWLCVTEPPGMIDHCSCSLSLPLLHSSFV